MNYKKYIPNKTETVKYALLFVAFTVTGAGAWLVSKALNLRKKV